jgi:hypothetical protein
VTELRVVAERAVGAPGDLVYRLIADFDRHHPHFLPSAFSQFWVAWVPASCTASG